MQSRNTRRESRHLAGRFRGGKMFPIGAFPLVGGESAVFEQKVTVELDGVVGRLITPPTLRITQVFVPFEALHKLYKGSGSSTGGVREVIRRELKAGTFAIPLENESYIAKLCGIHPVSIGGAKKTSWAVRGAYNCAVNALRKRLYVYATELASSNGALAPALLSSTAMQRLNGVLDPDDRINGAVALDIPSMQLPVHGIGINSDNVAAAMGAEQVRQTGGVVGSPDWEFKSGDGASVRQPMLRMDGAGAGSLPLIFAELDGLVAGGVSLTDFYNAERMDQITRRMRQIIEADPLNGEDAVLRWALGLSFDAGLDPVVVSQREVQLTVGYQTATDGAGIMDETMLSRVGGTISVRQVIPRTELGGVLMCLAEVKPDETLAEQPHPFFSEPWGAINHVAEELQLDPIPVKMRELSANVALADEDKTAFYTGKNELKRAYISYGYNRDIDLEAVETKNTIWQYEIPASVTPENINYPEDLDHYPFVDQLADVVHYSAQTNLIVDTPIFYGPTPVETVGVIDDEGLFDPEA